MPTPLCMECQHLTCRNYSLHQNSLTRVVLPSLRHLSASERLTYLHWLPVHYRIQVKIATLTYKTLVTCQPSYLYNLLQVYHPSRALCSSNQHMYHMYHICLLILVGVRSATALLQHGTPFLSPSKTVRPYIVSSAT